MKAHPTQTVYPIAYEEEYGDNGRKQLITHLGLSLRQHYAGIILAGLVAKYTLNAPEDQDTVCQMAVELANNLIKHLNNDN